MLLLRAQSLTQPVATATGGLEASAVDRLRQDLQAARRKHAKAAVEAKRHEVRAAVAAGSEHEESVARGQLDDLKTQYEDVAGFSTPAVREVGAEIGWADVEPLCEAKGCQITAHFGVEGEGIRVRCARHKEEGDVRRFRDFLHLGTLLGQLLHLCQHTANMSWRLANIIQKQQPKKSFIPEPDDLYRFEVQV